MLHPENLFGTTPPNNSGIFPISNVRLQQSDGSIFLDVTTVTTIIVDTLSECAIFYVM